MGNSEIALRSLNLFTDDFFAKFDPTFFKRLQEVSKNIGNLGWFGLIGSLISASFLFSNLIYAINLIFRAKYERSFVYNRLIEYFIMFVMGVILLISLSITAFWTALHRAIQDSDVRRQVPQPPGGRARRQRPHPVPRPVRPDLPGLFHDLQVHPGDEGPHRSRRSWRP